jgi:hypothetical protein
MDTLFAGFDFSKTQITKESFSSLVATNPYLN